MMQMDIILFSLPIFTGTLILSGAKNPVVKPLLKMSPVVPLCHRIGSTDPLLSLYSLKCLIWFNAYKIKVEIEIEKGMGGRKVSPRKFFSQSPNRRSFKNHVVIFRVKTKARARNYFLATDARMAPRTEAR